jgi:Neocarzinostatin family
MTRTGIGRLARLTFTAGLAAASVFVASGPVGASQPPAHIVARPSNLMVNTTTKLTGTGFAPNTSLTVKECSRTSWLLPKQPCATSNKLTVTTNASGGFRASMTAVVCPKVKAPGTRGFMETCYIGVPRTSKDSVVLVGAAKIIVTGP